MSPVVPLNLYNSLSVSPLLRSKQSLCAELEQVNVNVKQQPCCATITQALRFIRDNKLAILNHFGLCAWSYAICQQEPPLSWGDCVRIVERSIEQVLVRKELMQSRFCEEAVGDNNAWAVALDAWHKFYVAITTGCCARAPDGHMGARYVIRKTPDEPPYYGRTVCLPTLTPGKRTERSYGNRAECELALSQLPPQADAVPVLSNIYCNEYGCYEVPGWGRKPPYGFECASSGFCCGSTCSGGHPQETPYDYNTAAAQYQFYY
jgi:hypothetical protein